MEGELCGTAGDLRRSLFVTREATHCMHYCRPTSKFTSRLITQRAQDGLLWNARESQWLWSNGILYYCDIVRLLSCEQELLIVVANFLDTAQFDGVGSLLETSLGGRTSPV